MMHPSTSFTATQTRLVLLALAMFTTALAPTISFAHHPERETQPVHPRIDVIGPLGNRLPPSYRRMFNRPTYLGGKIAYHIAPSSQEAMAWHRAEHRGLYDGNCPRVVDLYFYPKPWEAMRTGQRRSVLAPETTKPARPDYGLSGEEGMISDDPLESLEAESKEADESTPPADVDDAPVLIEPVPPATPEFLPVETLPTTE